MSRSEYKRWNNEPELLDGRSVGKHHQWKPISRRSDPVSRAGSRWGGVGGINPQFQKKKDGAWALSVFFFLKGSCRLLRFLKAEYLFHSLVEVGVLVQNTNQTNIK
jgi:hypothetical protein